MKNEIKINLFFISIMILLSLILFVILKPINADTKKELIKRIIETAVMDGKIPDYNLIADKGNIVISSENIEPGLLPVLPNIRLIVLSPSEIKNRANDEGDFLYLKFSEMDYNNLYATMTIELAWADINRGHFNGGRMTIKFYNLIVKWYQRESIVLWVS